MRQHSSWPLFKNWAVINVDYNFRKSQTPTRQLLCGFDHVNLPSELFMTSSKLEVGNFQIRSLNRYGPYKCQILPVCLSLLFLFIIYSARSVHNRTAAAVFLLLKKYTLEYLAASINGEYVPVFSAR